MRELCSIYPYGLNDNVKGLGSISKLIDQDTLVVSHLFNKQDRKHRLRTGRRTKSKMYNELIDESLSQLLAAYKCCNFSRDMRTYILGLPRRKLGTVSKVLNGYLLREEIPSCIGCTRQRPNMV